MAANQPETMTVEAFLRWHERQPEGAHYELIAGRPVAMAPERAAHARLKARVWQALQAAIAARGLACEAFPDGMTVAVDEATAYEPDAVVHCGDRLDPDAVIVPRPLIVAEVLSPSSRGRDSGAKLADYFRVPGLVHYLIFKTERSAVIHHRLCEGGGIETRIVTVGGILLDPPGLEIPIDALYG
jgi:Uma2 family endonuclease